MRVLLVEDDRLVVRTIALVLRAAGIQHSDAGTGEEGIELARLYNYDVVILDLSLPDIHGYDVLRVLKRFGVVVMPCAIPTPNQKHL